MRLLEFVLPFLDIVDFNIIHGLGPRITFDLVGTAFASQYYYLDLEVGLKRVLWSTELSGASALINYYVLKFGFMRQAQLNRAAEVSSRTRVPR